MVLSVGFLWSCFELNYQQAVNSGTVAGSLFITFSQDGYVWPAIFQQSREHMELGPYVFFNPNSFLFPLG